MTTPLADYLTKLIRHQGPMTLERYMTLALSHPEYGYYTGRDPFGRGGDFITAPEISQIFGELIGIWCVSQWQALNTPDTFNIVELGPGRGTLMADLLRAANIMPGFMDAAKVHLVEISPVLQQRQKQTLKHLSSPPQWHDDPATIPDAPTIIIANEFFDALPIRQFIKKDGTFRERTLNLNDKDELIISHTDTATRYPIPDWAATAIDGDIIELSPARDQFAHALGHMIADKPSAALIIDYGHARPGIGDTLQAVHKHKPVDVLHHPGASDLTSHVDFAALAEQFELGGAKSHGSMSQGRFLLEMGLREREETLKKRADTRGRMVIARSSMRLAAGNQMGELFKVLAISHPDLPAPYPFAPHKGRPPQ